MTASQRQEFCVRWNSHLGSIGAAFPQLLAGQRFVDVTLACEGHQVHCHRLVLAACSSYFESILAENPCKHPVIILPSEIKLWEIQALVDFMYKGEVNVTQSGLPQLLRCAEQLRIRGLYGSDAALNLNQLKALSSKASTSAQATSAGGAATAAASASAAAASLAAASVASTGSNNLDSTDGDDTATNSTSTTTSTTTTTATSVLQQQQQQQQQHQQQQLSPQLVASQEVKKEILATASNGGINALQQQLSHHHQQQQQQNHQLQRLQQRFKQEIEMTTTSNTTPTSNAPTEDDSADDSTQSNAYEQYEEYNVIKHANAMTTASSAAAAAAAAAASQTMQQQHLQHDSTIEDDHNYVAAHDDEDDSFGGAADTEHETSGNSSLLQTSMDASGSYKRVRRSEASLAQAAKCVSKGETFQTVSNMFNIPVSTIRFYMARKGILPKRKRGRGASTALGTGALSNAVMSQALAQMKRSGSPVDAAAFHHHIVGATAMGYKMNEHAGII